MAKVSFEKKLAALESIAEALADGGIPLEDAVKQYEKGIGLLTECYGILERTEKKINTLMETFEGGEKTPE